MVEIKRRSFKYHGFKVIINQRGKNFDMIAKYKNMKKVDRARLNRRYRDIFTMQDAVHASKEMIDFDYDVK